MTQYAELLKKIDTLPPQFFGEVLDFVGYLQNKAATAAQTTNESPKNRIFGCSKGKYNFTESFFEPLEDFKDYM